MGTRDYFPRGKVAEAWSWPLTSKWWSQEWWSCTFTGRLCGLVVRVSGYRSRDPRFDSRPYQIFWKLRGLKRGPLSLVRTLEELLEWKSSGSGLENRLTAVGIRCTDHAKPSIRKVWH
jgi:hypothetical protein